MVSPLIPEGLESRGSPGSECGIGVLPCSSPPWTLGRPVATTALCGLSIWQMNEQSHRLCPSVRHVLPRTDWPGSPSHAASLGSLCSSKWGDRVAKPMPHCHGAALLVGGAENGDVAGWLWGYRSSREEQGRQGAAGPGGQEGRLLAVSKGDRAGDTHVDTCACMCIWERCVHTCVRVLSGSPGWPVQTGPLLSWVAAGAHGTDGNMAPLTNMSTPQRC